MAEADIERCVEAFALRQPKHPPRGLAGEQLGRESGASLEFHEHRSYMPGDDLRRIDWSAYARSDQLVVRLHRDEVSANLDVVVDTSLSMASTETKAERTRELVRLLRRLADKDQMNTGFWDCARLHGERDRDPPADTIFGGNRGLEALADTPIAWRRSGVRVLISDLLFTLPPRAIIQRAADGAAGLILLQVLDREELEPSLEGGRRLIDVENETVLDLQVSATEKERYRQRLRMHQELWRDEMRQHRGSFAVLCAQDSLEALARGPLLQSGLLDVRTA